MKCFWLPIALVLLSGCAKEPMVQPEDAARYQRDVEEHGKAFSRLALSLTSKERYVRRFKEAFPGPEHESELLDEVYRLDKEIDAATARAEKARRRLLEYLPGSQYGKE